MMELSIAQRKFKAFWKHYRRSVEDDSVTLELLEESARMVNSIFSPPLTFDELRSVISDLTRELEVTLTPGGSVVDLRTFVRWISERKIPTPRWDAYRELLESRDWAEPVVKNLFEQAEEVVELLGDPMGSGSWIRRGLLMGEVQSGKTANYLGILNLALDHGFKVIIVIGGHTNLLRKQTQARIDSDLLGIDSEFVDDFLAKASLRQIGVGTIDESLKAHLMTTVRRDFNEQSRTAGVHWIDSDIPTVFVIKKNAKLIANVANYIKQQSGAKKLQSPMLVVDDESDWGTPNTGSDTDPTRVNKEIRGLLEVSAKSTYLGITATPFANIFIDEGVQDPQHGQDLFPSDFVRVLSAPNTYLGISQYFQPRDGAIRVDVEDCLQILPIAHKRDHPVPYLPGSLKKAIVAFLLASTIRLQRNSTEKPASMLINVTRFNDVQSRIFQLVEGFISELAAVVTSEFKRESPQRSDLYDYILGVWEEEYKESSEVYWDYVKDHLDLVIRVLSVQLINSQTAASRNKARRVMSSEQRLEEDLRPTIYIGGDVLSRGITLEGLQVSYFVREPRTMDTLMQMGRWFGYRPGYMDLVRVWLSPNTADDFGWSASVTEELRDLLLEMKARGMTPRDFGLRVRTHPEGFLIVAANKSKATQQIYEGPIVWQACLRESYRLHAIEGKNAANMDALKALISELEKLAVNGEIAEFESRSGYQSWEAVPLSVVRDFFNRMSFPVQSLNFGPGDLGNPSLIQQALSEVKNFDSWEVSLVNGNRQTYPLSSGSSMRISLRDQIEHNEPDKTWDLANRRVSTGSNLAGSYKKLNAEKYLEPELGSQKQALENLVHPKLLIYLVARALDGEGGPTERDPAVAVAVAFPPLNFTEYEEKLVSAKKYVGNSVYLRNFYGPSLETDDSASEVEDV
jgi:hypothetical protein